jgi:hypothetical protein
LSVVALLLGIYGAALSTLLGYLAWRKDNRRLHMSLTQIHRGSDALIQITVFNTGFRPVALRDAHFQTEDGTSGYLMALDSELGLPTKLGEGDIKQFEFPTEEIWPETDRFVLSGYDREYTLVFAPETRRFIRQARPRSDS